MFDKLAVVLGLAILLFACYLLTRAYYPTLFSAKRENFVARPPATGPPVAAATNGPVVPVPAPAAPPTADQPLEKRVVAPGGPNPPNMKPPEDTPASVSPEAKPVDPYDDKNMEAPIQDSMRHPELSFGPGVDNTGMNKLATSGVASTKAMASESPFSPDFAQNCGSFMGTVFANDLTKDDRFATF